MDLKAAKAIIEAAAELGIEAELREDYSGLGYSRTTTGIVTDNPIKLLGAAISIAYEMGYYMGAHVCEDSDSEENLFESIGDLKMDSMGRSQIIY